MPLVYDQDVRVSDWVAQQLGYAEGPPVSATIGFERNGELVAGVLLDNYTGTNIFAHIAATAAVIPVEFLVAVARYVFVQCRARRMTFLVNDDNTEALQLVQDLGAEEEARLRMGHPRGDQLVFVLWDTGRFYRKLIATGRVVEGESFV
jgi:hypothetical protein